MDIKKLVRKNIRGLRAYEAAEIPCTVKLDANESPYGFNVLGELYFSRELFQGGEGGFHVKTNRYPDPEAKGLKRALAKRFRTTPESILPGNGSDELIYYLITTFGGPVLFPVPTFSMYGIIAQALNETVIAVPLDSAFDIDLEKTLQAMRRLKPNLIFLSSPNNPTGNCFSAERVMKIIEASHGIVVVDEAYQPFSSEKGVLPLLRDYRNLVIMRTLSKIGMAALRLGFLIADPLIIAEVNKVRLPFNVNSFSQAIAVQGLKNKSGLRSAVNAIVSERERLVKEMNAIEGITPFPSEANFILFRMKKPDAVYAALLKRGILVRAMGDAVKGCLRVTVGTPEENTRFLAALREISPRTISRR